jgi:hypothetical protein
MRDDDVRATLEANAKITESTLPPYLRDIATDRAKVVRKEKDREASRRVAAHKRDDPEACEYYGFWDPIARYAHGANRGR